MTCSGTGPGTGAGTGEGADAGVLAGTDALEGNFKPPLKAMILAIFSSSVSSLLEFHNNNSGVKVICFRYITIEKLKNYLLFMLIFMQPTSNNLLGQKI